MPKIHGRLLIPGVDYPVSLIFQFGCVESADFSFVLNDKNACRCIGPRLVRIDGPFFLVGSTLGNVRVRSLPQAARSSLIILWRPLLQTFKIYLLRNLRLI